MNEAHDGWTHCPRTRAVGRRSCRSRTAWACATSRWRRSARPRRRARERGARARGRQFGYLGQPDMRALVDAALDLGWMLHAYEADAVRALRRLGQAGRDQLARGSAGAQPRRRRRTASRRIGADPRLVRRRPPAAPAVRGRAANPAIRGVWIPMGSLVEGYGGVEPFAIDQNIYGRLRRPRAPVARALRGRPAGARRHRRLPGRGHARRHRRVAGRPGRRRLRALARQRDDGSRPAGVDALHDRGQTARRRPPRASRARAGCTCSAVSRPCWRPGSRCTADTAREPRRGNGVCERVRILPRRGVVKVLPVASRVTIDDDVRPSELLTYTRFAGRFSVTRILAAIAASGLMLLVAAGSHRQPVRDRARS